MINWYLYYWHRCRPNPRSLTDLIWNRINLALKSSSGQKGIWELNNTGIWGFQVLASFEIDFSVFCDKNFIFRWKCTKKNSITPQCPVLVSLLNSPWCGSLFSTVFRFQVIIFRFSSFNGDRSHIFPIVIMYFSVIKHHVYIIYCTWEMWNPSVKGNLWGEYSSMDLTGDKI